MKKKVIFTHHSRGFWSSPTVKFLGHLLPLVVFFVVKSFVTGEMVTTVFILLVFGVYLYLDGFKKREGWFFIFGVVIGFLIEVALGAVYREQFWVNASLFGVPAWLPLAWGMGFVVIRRLGDIMVLRR